MKSGNNINIITVYLSSVIAGCAFYVMYWFAPWAYGLFPGETQSILSYSSFDAWFEIPEWFSWGLFLTMLISYAGMFLFVKMFRTIFLVLNVVVILSSPVYGVSILTGLEVILVDASTLLSGVILGIAYFSPVSERFESNR